MEDKAAIIKNWIKNTRKGKPLADHGILISTQENQNLKVTLLDTACCIPAILFEKNLDEITEADIAAKSHFINHSH